MLYIILGLILFLCSKNTIPSMGHVMRINMILVVIVIWREREQIFFHIDSLTSFC